MPLTALAPVGDEFGPLPTVQSMLDLSGGIVFEMNNRLMPVIGYAELAQEKLDSINPVAKHASEIRRIASGRQGVHN